MQFLKEQNLVLRNDSGDRVPARSLFRPYSIAVGDGGK